MIITPFDALEPYIAVADASFNTVKLSMSFGFKAAKTEVVPLILSVLFSIGNPSITINGSFEALKEEPPLILISEPEPGAPLVLTVKPATLPLSKFSAVTLDPLLKSFVEIVVTEPVTSFFLTVP